METLEDSQNPSPSDNPHSCHINRDEVLEKPQKRDNYKGKIEDVLVDHEIHLHSDPRQLNACFERKNHHEYQVHLFEHVFVPVGGRLILDTQAYRVYAHA